MIDRRLLAALGAAMVLCGPLEPACGEEPDRGSDVVAIGANGAVNLAGGDSEENAAILTRILEGELGPRRDIVALNAAAALWAADAVPDIGAGLAAACESLDSGAARDKLAALVRVSQERST